MPTYDIRVRRTGGTALRRNVIPTLCGTVEEATPVGDAKGHAEGDAKGHAEVDAKGHAVGDAKGDAKGHAEGDAKGHAEGDGGDSCAICLEVLGDDGKTVTLECNHRFHRLCLARQFVESRKALAMRCALCRAPFLHPACSSPACTPQPHPQPPGSASSGGEVYASLLSQASPRSRRAFEAVVPAPAPEPGHASGHAPGHALGHASGREHGDPDGPVTTRWMCWLGCRRTSRAYG